MEIIKLNQSKWPAQRGGSALASRGTAADRIQQPAATDGQPVDRGHRRCHCADKEHSIAAKRGQSECGSVFFEPKSKAATWQD